MDLDIKKLEEVWTADAKKLGLAYNLFHRLEDIDPDVQNYASYLEVQNYELGDDYYVPTDFIDGRDPETGRVMLKVSLQEVLARTWSQMPEFIARGQGRKDLLPQE